MYSYIWDLLYKHMDIWTYGHMDILTYGHMDIWTTLKVCIKCSDILDFKVSQCIGLAFELPHKLTHTFL